MVKKFHQKHQFILNVNLHAMEALSKQTLFKKVSLSTIVLSPINKEALRSVILERHKIGGLDMVLRSEENRIDGKHFNHLMNKIFLESNGNIGLGLQIWLRHISTFLNDKIYLEEQPILETLKVNEAYWKWILYQFLLNKNLSIPKLKALFGENSPEIVAYLPELIKAEILEEQRKNIYTLNKIVKPNIENWLKHCNILN